MDQSFSPRNLREIWDIQTRKGADLLRLFSTPEARYREYRRYRELGRRIRNDWKLQPYDAESIAESIAVAKAAADEALDASLAATSQRLIRAVETGQFAWGVAKTPVNKNRQTYTLAQTAEVYFADKQMQRSIAAVTEHRRMSRSSSIGALMLSLDNLLPKAVVRVDVERFYETIDHSLLKEMLKKSPLTRTAIELASLLLDEYADLTGVARGLPTGVGLSAKLSEMYIGQIDFGIANSSEVLFYTRYVDDIIAVVGLPEATPKSDSELLAIAATPIASLGLGINPSKTAVRRLSGGSIPPFDFLGYSVWYAGSARASLTNARVQAIKDRVDRVLDAWDRCDQTNHGRRKLLLDRLRLLTGNTRLTHNKRNALVGIYFSNPHLTEMAPLRTLDFYLKRRLGNSTFPNELATKLQDLSFERGFTERRMHKFSVTQLKKIRGVWL